MYKVHREMMAGAETSQVLTPGGRGKRRGKEMKQKILAVMTSQMLLISTMIAFGGAILMPTICADTVTVTGSFSAHGNLTVSVNDSTPDFGNITTGYANHTHIEITNGGSCAVDITQDQAVKDSGDLTIDTNDALIVDEYKVGMNQTIDGTEWNNVGQNDAQNVTGHLLASATHDYQLRVEMSSSMTKLYASSEAFSVDLTAVEHT